MLILYTTEDGKSQIQLRAQDETVWLSQREIAELFDVNQDNIGLHLKNIYKDQELSQGATTEESSVVQIEVEREVRRPLGARLYENTNQYHSFQLRHFAGRVVSKPNHSQTTTNKLRFTS